MKKPYAIIIPNADNSDILNTFSPEDWDKARISALITSGIIQGNRQRDKVHSLEKK